MARNAMKLSFTSELLDFVGYVSDEDAGIVFKALRIYILENRIEIESRLMPLIQPLIKCVDKQRAISEERAKAGSVKGKNLGNQHACKNKKVKASESKTRSEPKHKVVKQGENIPPTIEEVREYVKSKNIDVDPDKFWNFHQSKGWVIGKVRMKNWHCAIATWVKRQKSDNKNATANKKSPSQKQNPFDLFNNLFVTNGNSTNAPTIIDRDCEVVSG